MSGAVSQWSLTFEVRKRRLEVSRRVIAEQSQWSLTFEVRKRALVAAVGGEVDVVAMEPDL